MAYMTKLVNYHPMDKRMAEEVETAANDMEKEGWELVTFSITNNGRAILVFRQLNS